LVSLSLSEVPKASSSYARSSSMHSAGSSPRTSFRKVPTLSGASLPYSPITILPTVSCPDPPAARLSLAMIFSHFLFSSAFVLPTSLKSKKTLAVISGPASAAATRPGTVVITPAARSWANASLREAGGASPAEPIRSPVCAADILVARKGSGEAADRPGVLVRGEREGENERIGGSASNRHNARIVFAAPG